MFKIASAILFLCLQVPYVFAENTASEEESTVDVETSVAYYFLPDQDDLITPTLSLSWENFYMEARYAYENRDTASLFVGVPFSYSDEIDLEIIPMLGGITGKTDGMAPGLELDATWKRFNLYSEAEYVFDFETREGNFLYSWSELTFALFEQVRIGIAGSRTRAYDSDVELDRGPLLAYETERMNLSIAALNIDSDPITMISASITF